MFLSLLTLFSHLFSYVLDFRDTASALGALRSLRLAMTSNCARFLKCLADILPATGLKRHRISSLEAF